MFSTNIWITQRHHIGLMEHVVSANYLNKVLFLLYVLASLAGCVETEHQRFHNIMFLSTRIEYIFIIRNIQNKTKQTNKQNTIKPKKKNKTKQNKTKKQQQQQQQKQKQKQNTPPKK